MFKLAIEVCLKSHFELIHYKFSSLRSTKSVYFFWDTRYQILGYLHKQNRTGGGRGLLNDKNETFKKFSTLIVRIVFARVKIAPYTMHVK